MAQKIILIRHGETAWSLSGQHTSNTDLPLTPNGERQAVALRGRLQEFSFARVLTSPLLRARRTCELAGFLGDAREDADLKEWDYGDYEGKTTAAIQAQRPGWNVFRDGCPNGESPEAIGARADRVVQALRAMDGLVGVFSHGHFLRVLAMRWIGLPVVTGQYFKLDAASISILGHEHETDPAITLWNAGEG